MFLKPILKKHLGVILDIKLTPEEDLNNVLAKVKKPLASDTKFVIYYQGQR